MTKRGREGEPKTLQELQEQQQEQQPGKRVKQEAECEFPPLGVLALEEEMQGRCPPDKYAALKERKCPEAVDPIEHEPIPPNRMLRLYLGPGGNLQCYNVEALRKWIAVQQLAGQAPSDPLTRTPFSGAQIKAILEDPRLPPLPAPEAAEEGKYAGVSAAVRAFAVAGYRRLLVDDAQTYTELSDLERKRALTDDEKSLREETLKDMAKNINEMWQLVFGTPQLHQQQQADVLLLHFAGNLLVRLLTNRAPHDLLPQLLRRLQAQHNFAARAPHFVTTAVAALLVLHDYSHGGQIKDALEQRYDFLDLWSAIFRTLCPFQLGWATEGCAGLNLASVKALLAAHDVLSDVLRVPVAQVERAREYFADLVSGVPALPPVFVI